MSVEPADRIKARLVPDGECLVFTGARNAQGYGRVNVAGKIRNAHRALYEATHGPVPDGLVVMHTCDNPPCCRLDHLRLGTVADNNRNAQLKGRCKAILWLNSQKTECKWGHPLSGDNVELRPTGRRCRTCRRREARLYKQRRKALS